jgi:hypothetical protein
LLHNLTWKTRGKVYYEKSTYASLMVARPGQSLLGRNVVSPSNVSTTPRLEPAIFISPNNGGWLLRDMAQWRGFVTARHVNVIDDPNLVMARLAASDEMFRRFGLPPGQAGAHHKGLRELFALNPLADMGQSFVVMDPPSGAPVAMLAAVDSDGNPMCMREASLKLCPTNLAVPGQGAVRRAKKGADAVL